MDRHWEHNGWNSAASVAVQYSCQLNTWAGASRILHALFDACAVGGRLFAQIETELDRPPAEAVALRPQPRRAYYHRTVK